MAMTTRRRPISRSIRSFRSLETLENRVLMAASYFVAPTGLDTNPGTSAAPFKTLQKAANMVAAGDVVTVRGGTYAGFVLGWDFDVNGTASAPITFRADPAAAKGSVIVNARNNRTADGINLEGSSYIIIDGFNVNNAAGSITRAGIRSVLNHHVTIRNNTADHCGTWGILTGFSDDITIENNTTSNSQIEHGIYISNSGDRPIIRGNRVFNNRANGIHMNGDLSQGGDGIISGAIVENNIIYNNGVGGGSGINCDGVQDSLIRNNLLYNNHASGISLYRIDGAQGSRNNTVVNNTIVMPADGRWALNIINASTGNTVFNNIFHNSHSFRGSITISADSLSGFHSDYNVVDGRFSRDGGNSAITLAAWRTATGNDTHSILSTPSALFANVAGSDYRLSATSPAKDMAIDTYFGKAAPTLDLAGNSRPQGSKRDIGAYERPLTFQPAPIDLAGNTLQTARQLGLFKTSLVRAYEDYASTSDRNDMYQFNVTSTLSLEIKLHNMSDDADLMLLNSSGQRIGYSKRSGSNDERITMTLAPGTYYVRVLFVNGVSGTNYRLRMAAA